MKIHYQPIYTLLICYALFRVFLFILIPHNGYIPNNDGLDYYNLAHQTLFSSAFWCGSRSFILPLLIKLCFYQIPLVFAVQLLLSILAWCFALWVSYQLSNESHRWFSILMIFLLGVQPYLLVWDGKILTESLSISSTIVFLSALLWCFTHGFSRQMAMIAGIAAFISANTRDSNAYLVLCLSILTLVIVLVYWHRFKPCAKQCLLLVLAGCFSFLAACYSANMGQRWLVPMEDLLGARIIENPALLAAFEKNQMPDADIAALIAQVKQINDPYYGSEVAGQQFVTSHTQVLAWFQRYSKSVYENFLWEHPQYSIQVLRTPAYWASLVYSYMNFPQYLTYNQPALVDEYSQILFASTFHGNVNSLFYLPLNPIIKTLYSFSLTIDLLILLWAFVALFFYSKRILDPSTLFCIISIVLIWFILGVLVWLAEPMEVIRHQVTNHISFMLLLASLPGILVTKPRHD